MIKHITLASFVLLTVLLTGLVFILPTPDKNYTDPRNMTSETTRLIENVRVVQNGELSAPQSIVIRGGVIVDIGPSIQSDAIRIDGNGLTAIAGLIDAHTHSYGSALKDALRFGVTTNVDMFSDISLVTNAKQSRQSQTNKTRSDLFSAGMMATAPGGHGTQYGIGIETLTHPDQADEWVAKRKAEGSDFIKMVYMPGQTRIPSLDRAMAQALIQAAHKHDLLALAHISTQDAARDLMEDGIDGLVHIFADEPVTDEVVKLAKQNDVFIIPTLAVIASVDGRDDTKKLAGQEGIAERLSQMQSQTINLSFPGRVPGFNFEIASANVRRFHAEGVTILAGSDAPNPGTAHGLSLHQELQYLVDSGLSPLEALSAATTLTAKAFSMDDRGEIKIGYKGDILLIRGNPLEDIGATLAIETILKNGHQVERATKTPKAPSALISGLLGDFETGLSVQEFEWFESSDVMANGKSTAVIKRGVGGPDDSTHVLNVSGSINPGFPYPWAGAAVMPKTRTDGFDISKFESVNFSIKGKPGTYRVMVFTAGNFGIPPEQSFQVIENWEQVSLPIQGFKGFDAKAFAGLSIVASSQGPFELELDNVILK